MQNRVQLSQENPLWISWHDTNWIPILNASNVMDYFSEKSNPFYDHTCNNAIVRMQRQSMEQLNNMVGVEYILLHAQDPILYVVRKQHRHSPTEVTPLANYYIIAGIVYQAPDLANVFNSRILSTVHQLQTAFEEASSYSRYNPNKGYSWDFSSNKALSEKERSKNKKEDKTKEEPSSLFQRQRVDMLLGELMKKFAFPLIPQVMQIQQQQQQNATKTSNSESENQTEANETANMNGNSESGQDPKSDMKPPPEKKMKL